MSTPINNAATGFSLSPAGMTRDFLHWWFAQLAGFLPPAMRSMRSGDRRRVIVDVGDNRIAVGLVERKSVQVLGNAELRDQEAAKRLISAAQGRADLRNAEVVVRLDPVCVLQRSVILPLAAEENLRQVLGFEMDRQTPFRADQVHYDYQVLERRENSKTIVLRLVVVPRAFLDDLLTSVRALGIEPTAVTIREDDTESPTPAINLFPRDLQASRYSNQRRINAVLALLLSGLGATALAIPMVRQHQAVLSLERELAEAQLEVQSTDALRGEAERLHANLMQVLEQRGVPPFVEILNELTRIIPDSTWLHRCEVKGKTLEIQGHSSAASALVGLLEASALFENVSFSSPVTRDPRSGAERFQLSARLSAREVP